jgi:hypothetical protein
MDEKGRGAGAGQRRCDLARYMAGLADARHDHPTSAGKQQTTCGDEGVIDTLFQCRDGLTFDGNNLAPGGAHARLIEHADRVR